MKLAHLAKLAIPIIAALALFDNRLAAIRVGGAPASCKRRWCGSPFSSFYSQKML